MTPSEQLNPLLRNRFSPLIFDEKNVSRQDVLLMFEAARWVPSAFNEQPWRFVYALKEDEGWDNLFALLTDGNKAWVKSAAGIILTFSSTTFALNEKPNPHNRHDLGLAVMALTIQAAELGIFVHQMSGFDKEKAETLFVKDDKLEAVTMAAFGYPGDKSTLEGKLAERASAERKRKDFGSLVFRNDFTHPEMY